MKEFFIDDISLTITCDADLGLAELEQKLRLRGYTLGYEPVVSRRLSLRQILDQAIPNRWAARHGEISDICMAVLVQNEMGQIQTKKVPRAATGPDLKKIFIGSKGRYGKIIEATLRISPLPEKRKTIKIQLKKKNQISSWIHKILASGLRPVEIHENGTGLSMTLEGSSSMIRAEEQFLRKISKIAGKHIGS